MIHNFFAGILPLTATLCALAGSILQWTNHTATSLKPTQQLVQAIARDEAVKEAATDLLHSSIEQRILESVNQVPGLCTKLKETVGTGVNTAMSSPKVQSAWKSTLNDSCETLPKDLTEYGSGRTRIPPSVKVNLDPLISRTWQAIYLNVDLEISTYMGQSGTPTGVQVKAADIPAQQADQASQILAPASYWWLFHVVAGLLLIGGLLLGTRIDRWVLLAVFAAAGLSAVALIRDLGEFVTFSNSGSQLVWTIETQITRQLSSSLSSRLDPFWYGYLGLMTVGLVVAVAKGVREPA